GRTGAAGAGKSQPLLAGDERMLHDLADRLGGASVENGIEIADRRRAEAGAVDLHQRFKPVHAPARRAVDLVTLCREGFSQLVGAQRAGEGIVGNTDNHRTFSISSTSPAESSRAWSRSPV